MRLAAAFTILAAVAVVPLWAAQDEVKSGPEVGSNAPLIHIDAFNDDGGDYCITCRAGNRPLAILFATADNDGNKDLLMAFDEAREANKETRLQTAIVLIGGEDDEALADCIKEAGLKVPAGVLSKQHRDYPNWHINTEVANTVVLIRGHRIKASVPNVAADAIADHVANLLK